jgi:hypothetical protein
MATKDAGSKINGPIFKIGKILAKGRIKGLLIWFNQAVNKASCLAPKKMKINLRKIISKINPNMAFKAKFKKTKTGFLIMLNYIHFFKKHQTKKKKLG